MKIKTKVMILLLAVSGMAEIPQSSWAGHRTVSKRPRSGTVQVVTSDQANISVPGSPSKRIRAKTSQISTGSDENEECLVETASTDIEVDQPLQMGIRTPKRSRLIQNTFLLTPRSKYLKSAIYIFHDFPGTLDFDKLDLKNQKVLPQEIVDLTKSFRQIAEKLRGQGIHIYVGLAGANSKDDRTLSHRYKEHGGSCNRGDNLRNYRFIRECAKAGKKVTMQGVVHNIHPDQIRIFEAYFIKIFGGMDDYGLNSNISTWGSAEAFFGDVDPFPALELEAEQGSDQESEQKLTSVAEVATPSVQADFVIARGTSKFSIIGSDGTTSGNGALLVTPNSKEKKRVVYLIHDFPGRLNYRKVNFKNKKVTKEVFLREIAGLQKLAKDLRAQKIHLYTGEVGGGSETNLNRKLIDRAKEHVRSCNRGSNQRDYIGLRKCADQGKKAHMQAMLYNVHPRQIFIFESYLIRLFGGIDDFGWNSNAGHSEAYYEFFGDDADPALLSEGSDSTSDSSDSSDLEGESSSSSDDLGRARRSLFN